MNRVKMTILAVMILTITITGVLILVSLNSNRSASENSASSSSVDIINLGEVVSNNSVSEDIVSDTVSEDAVIEDAGIKDAGIKDSVEHDGKLSFLDKDGHAFFTIEKKDFVYSSDKEFYQSMSNSDNFEISYLTNVNVEVLEKIYEVGASLEDMRDGGYGTPCLYFAKCAGEMDTPYGTMKIFKYCYLGAEGESGTIVNKANITYTGILPVDGKIIRFIDGDAARFYDRDDPDSNEYFDSLGVPVNFGSYVDLTEAFDSDEELYDKFVEKATAAFE